MPNLDQPPRYRAYLLRFWEERGQPTSVAVWRFSLEDPHTGQRHGFATLDALLAFLQTQIDGEQQSHQTGDE